MDLRPSPQSIQPDIPPSISPLVPTSKTNNHVFISIIIGVIILGIGITVGLFLGKTFKNPFAPKPTIASYKECLQAKGSIVTESYPGICITTSGQRFIQPLTDEEKQNLLPPDQARESTDTVSCGGWNTGGSVECTCTGTLIKPTCPPNTICDAIDYQCEGQCGQCCWRGIAENNQYPRCQN